MFTPLKTFEAIVIQTLSKRPFEFWAENAQEKMIDQLKKVTESLESALAQKKLTDTQTYKIVHYLTEVISASPFDEVAFIQGLSKSNFL